MEISKLINGNAINYDEIDSELSDITIDSVKEIDND